MVPATLTLTGGTSANVTILMDYSGGFAGTVSFGCTPPAGSNATCSFKPASLSAGGVTTMTVNTTAASTTTTSRISPRHPRGWAVGSTLSLASLLFLALPRRRHPAFRLLLVGALSALLGLSGCGQGGSATQSTTTTTTTTPTTTTSLGTPLGTSNFVITAAGTNGTNTSRHTYQYQVTVQ